MQKLKLFIKGGHNMVKKTSYLSQPRNVGMGIAIPREARLDEKTISAILKAEFPRDIYEQVSKEKRYQFSWRPNPNEMYGYDPKEYKCKPKNEKCVSVTEVFARLEKEKIGVICSKKDSFYRNITTILCDKVGILQDDDLFRNLTSQLHGSEFAQIYWEKEDSEFSLTLDFGKDEHFQPTFSKTVRADSLMKCFEELDMFFFQ